VKGCSSGLEEEKEGQNREKADEENEDEPVVTADLGCEGEGWTLSTMGGKRQRKRGRTVASFGFLEQPLKPTSLEAVAMKDVRKAVAGVHARVVGELGALNEHWMQG
jgi:hypothetical protein